jgi:hypothetical protein
MTVTKDKTKQGVPLKWDKDIVQGETADLRCTNPNNLEDVSTRDGTPNDGHAVVTFPADYTGECNVSVSGSDGGEDTGVVEV